MKNKLINFSITTIIVSIVGFILSLLVSLFSSLNLFSLQINDNIMIAVSLVIFFLFGFIFGLKEKRRGLLNGLLLIILYLGFMFSFRALNPSFNYSSWYITLSRCSLILLGSIIGVNISNRG